MINILKKIIESLIRNIGGRFGVKIRYFYYKNQFYSCGKNVIIEEGVFFENPQNMSLGNNIWIDKSVVLIAGAFKPNNRNYYQKENKSIEWGDLIISNGVHIAPFSLIQAHGGLKIGENVTIASGAKLYSLSHHYRNLIDENDNKRYSFSTMAKIENQFLIVGNITIGDNAAVGINSVILPGTDIPDGTWIGVLSVVNNNKLKSNTIFTSAK